MDTPETITEGMSLWAIEKDTGRILENDMPFRVSHVSRHEIIGVDDGGNNRAFDRSVFEFTR